MKKMQEIRVQFLGWEDRLEEGTTTHSSILFFFTLFIFFFSFIFISWRLITSQHCSGFGHTLTWISHGATCIPHPDPPSHLPPHPIPLGFRTAAIQKSTSNKCWRGCGEKGTLLHCWWECKLVQPLWKTVWRFLKKLEIELPYDPAIPPLGTHTEETRSERDTCTPMFITALFIIAILVFLPEESHRQRSLVGYSP